jgi:ferric-dicitrate binding protein FerR (iron transport regulator)
MDQIIVRLLQGVATPEEEEWLRRWRSETPENDERYREVKRLWELTALLDPRIMRESPPRFEGVILTAEGREPYSLDRTLTASVLVTDQSLPDTASIQARLRRNRKMWFATTGLGAIAASLVALGFGLAALGDEVEASGPFAGSEVVTGAGELTTVTLIDGSSIRIGPSSRLVLTEDAAGIVAHLDGRAFFAVHSNPSRSFRVITDHGDATVFGTRFEVRTEEEEFRVLVVEGRVRVNSPDGVEVYLLESEMSVSDGGAPPTKITVVDVYEQLAWMGNALVFQRTPLVRVAAEIERQFGISVVLEAPELSETTVSVTFTDAELDDVISVVCEIVWALCLIDDDRVRILRDVPATRISTT